MIKYNEIGELQVKKLTIIICLGLSFLMILDSVNAGQALAMFFLAGVIPGTNISVEAGQMFEFFTLLTGFTLSRITLSLFRLAKNVENRLAI